MAGYSKIHGLAHTAAEEFAAFLEHTFGLTIDKTQHKQLCDEFNKHVSAAARAGGVGFGPRHVVVGTGHHFGPPPDRGGKSTPKGADGQSKPALAPDAANVRFGPPKAV